MAAGEIVISLLMKTASFSTDSARAAKDLEKLKKQAADLGKAFGVGVAGAVTGLAYLVKSTIDSNDHLNDLSKKTGIAVDTLGGIGFAAGQAGGDLDSAAAAAGKLNKSLVEAAGGNKDLAATFKALGVNVKDADGNVKTADVALVELADKFASFEEGPEKAALAVKLFGKSGADMLPLLDDGGKALQENIAYFKRYSGVTQTAAEQADAFNDTTGKLKLLSGAFGQQLTAALLPSLQNLADLWLKNKEEGDGFASTASRLADVFKGVVVGVAFLGTTFAVTGEQIGAFAAKIGALARGDFGQVAEIGKDASANLEKARKDFGEFYDAIYNGRKKIDDLPQADYSNEGRNNKAKKSRAPVITDPAEIAAQQQALKKQLDAQLKLIEDFGKAQGQAYQFANSYLEAAYNDAELSQKDFFEQQQNVRDAALRAELDAIDKQIAAQRAFIANPASKAEDRVAAEDKIKLAVQQRAEVVTKASQTEILANQANAQAVQQLQDAYGELKAQILQAVGDDAGAAAIRNAQAVKRARDLITQAGGDPALADQQAKILDNQVRAAQIQKDYNKLLDDTARKEQEIYLAAEAGGQGELETLAAIRDARKAAIAQLQQQASAAAQLAAESGTEEDKKRAADLALAAKKALGEIDPLAQKVNASLQDAFTSPFADFLKGTKSASDAFKDFTANVLADIAQLAAKDLATSIFGGNSGQGGIGAAFSSLFGSSSGGSGSGSGDTVSSLASFFGGFFADGGDPPMNKVSIVGEKGPEAFVPHTRGTVLPNSLLKGGTTNQRNQTNNITVALPPGADRRTGMQIGADIARQINIASARNN